MPNIPIGSYWCHLFSSINHTAMRPKTSCWGGRTLAEAEHLSPEGFEGSFLLRDWRGPGAEHCHKAAVPFKTPSTVLSPNCLYLVCLQLPFQPNRNLFARSCQLIWASTDSGKLKIPTCVDRKKSDTSHLFLDDVEDIDVLSAKVGILYHQIPPELGAEPSNASQSQISPNN